MRSVRSVAIKRTAAVGGGYVLKLVSEHLSQRYQKYHSTTIYVYIYMILLGGRLASHGTLLYYVAIHIYILLVASSSVRYA